MAWSTAARSDGNGEMPLGANVQRIGGTEILRNPHPATA